MHRYAPLVLTADDRDRIHARARAAIDQPTLRRDAWRFESIVPLVVLGAFVLYSTWSAIANAHYYVHPYISPLYAPCIASACEHVTFPIIGSWWRWSPALLIIIFPLGFRTTCYFYRRVYYRSAFRSPPACAVREPARGYKGESRLPLAIQNVHRYFFYVAVILAILHFYDLVLATQFEDGFGIGLGTLLMGVDAALLGAYVFSCHACRHAIGGHVDRFSAAPVRHRLWKWSSKLNLRHGPIAWASLVAVVVVDLYVKALSAGWLTDPRLI